MVWRAFSLAHTHLMRTFDDALREENGLSLSEYEVLYTVASSPDARLRISELSDSLLFTRGGVSRVVTRLETKGYLQRESVDDDLRGVTAVLTDEGYSVFVPAARDHVARLRQHFLEPVGRDGRALQRVLGRILAVHHGDS